MAEAGSRTGQITPAGAATLAGPFSDSNGVRSQGATTSESSPRPIFLFGMERSGTTLLSMMVGAHRQIAVPLATTGMWIEFAERLKHFNDLANQADLRGLVDEVLAHERVALWDATFDRGNLLRDLPLGDYGAVVARFHSEYARAKGKPFWANIDIATLDSMDLVNSWFPDSVFVHIVRDGRDVALSHQTMPYGAGNIAECARAWSDRTMMNLKMGRVLGPQRYLSIRFEDLILDTEASLRKICQFLGVPFDPSMLRHGDMVDEKIPEDRRWLWPSIAGAPEASKAGQWRHKMTRSQRIVFERFANRALKTWGYEAYDTVPKSASAHCLDLWYYLTQGGRLRRLRRRLGLNNMSLLERQAMQQKERQSRER
jgi:hypothetical protein